VRNDHIRALSPLGDRMRIRATVAAVSGALALSALVAPGAHAAGSDGHRADIAKVREAARAASGKTPFTGSTGSDGEPYELALNFSNVVGPPMPCHSVIPSVTVAPSSGAPASSVTMICASGRDVRNEG